MNNPNNPKEQLIKNSNGHYVPESLIKPVDKMRDQLVQDLIKEAKELQQKLAAFKTKALDEMNAFVELSHEQYGVKRSGKKGNLQLLSFDGSQKIVIRNQEYLAFDERIEAAKELIDQCMVRWTQAAGTEIKAVINHAFRTNKQGNLRTQAIIDLKNLNIEDPQWQTAIRALMDSIQVAGSTLYINFYERIGATDQWQHISLDMASI